MCTRRAALLLALLASAIWAAKWRDRDDTYAVILSEPPVGPRLARPMKAPVVRARADEPVIQALAAAVGQTQQPVREAVAQMNLPIVGSTRYVLNAVFVKATSAQADRLRALTGVSRVVRMARYHKMLNAAADLINAPAAWNAIGGIDSAGAGIKVGVLETGMDINNPALQDPSLTPPAGFPKALPQNLPFTNNKIIVARSYVCPGGTIDPATSRPDDCSPADRSGHGTFVATMIAGRRINTTGPAINGIAPKAFLGNYKISGSTDLNDFPSQAAILQALDDAVSDGMDIVNMSLGSIAVFAPDDQGAACGVNAAAFCDPLAQGIQIAVNNFGVVVVTAAGNDGDRGKLIPTLNTISSPSTAADAIAVGATTNSRQLVSTLRGGAGAPGSLQSVPALFGSSPRPQQPLAGRIRSVEDVGDDGAACNALPARSLAGQIALIRRGGCDFDDKVSNAQTAGAVAVVIYNSQGFDFPIPMTGLVRAAKPAVMIGNSAGVALRDYARSSSATVTLDPQLVPQSITPDQVAVFSSRGPGIDGNLKPELVAPGTAIFSATQTLDPNGAEYDPTGFTSLEGTSFSTALVTGAAALVEQKFANFAPWDVKSALVNTASSSVTESGQQARATSIGAGKLNASAALNPGATLDPAAIGFGEVLRSSDLPVSGTVVLTNVGAASDTFRIDVQQRDPDSNARVTVNGSSSTSGTIGAGQAARITVALSGSLPRPGVYEGVIRVQGTSSGTNLRLPYYYGVPSGRPTNIFAIAGDGSIGTAGKALPDLLILKLIDDFGFPVQGQDVQFRATQGGGSIFQADAKTDVYGIAAADVNLGATLGEQIFAATTGGLTVTFDTAARAAPSINTGGIVSAASFAQGRTVAPGSIVSIFGLNLAETIAIASKIPLPMVLRTVSVSFDQPDAGVSAPGRIFFISPGQINVQVPWELAGLTFAMVKVRIGNSVSAVVRLELGDYSPGIFEYDAGGGQKLGAITHAKGQVVTPSNPARRGETVIVYATGVGPVDQPQKSGEAASGQTLANTKQLPTATVGSQQATVLFSGLAPFFVGLNQLNITIPSGAPTGVQPLIVTSNGVAANTVNVPVQ